MARPKGAKNKHCEESKLTLLETIKAKGKATPIDYLLSVMWNGRAELELRIEAAKAAAPYIHRKQPTELQHIGAIEIIPPSLPSRRELAEKYNDLGDA